MRSATSWITVRISQADEEPAPRTTAQLALHRPSHPGWYALDPNRLGVDGKSVWCELYR
ncbi:hypothetical protein AABB02_26125 [Streptomyces rimosus]|uniref:hypothetical protein n=1 Tax=Streptomyces rimosus TaxID=1927 RepID=UPI0031D50A08